ncbi:MAG TPA: T9SS type A sorting domain-containing protein [Bacteroidota bacterium]|nr:T9SS type A sorting domain-containing protein [Bacteroidota bacterium]
MGQMMKAGLFRLMAAASVICLSAGSAGARSLEIDSTLFYSNQILACPTDSSITIRVVPRAALRMYYEYGASSSSYSSQSETIQTTPSVPAVITLKNLLPNTRYFYRLRYQIPGSSSFIAGDGCTFTTRRSKGSTFVFTITCDSHLYDKKGIPSMMEVTMGNIAADRPDFDFEMGDTFGDDHTPATTTLQDMMQLHLNTMKYIGLVCHSAPFLFVLGNHEGESGYYMNQTPPNNIAVYGTLARKYYYSFPSPGGMYTGNSTVEPYGIGLPQNYYAFEWGDALFVILDVYRYPTASDSPGLWDWTLGKEQYDWLKQTLESSSAKFRFVFAHHVRGYGRGAVAIAKNFEWGGYENNGTTWGFSTNRPGWAMPVHQLMVRNGVNIFFQGHDHLFAQEVLDGLIYQECPMPSDSTYMIGYLANADAYTSNQLNGSGHIRVTVSPTQTKVDYVQAYLPRDTNAVQRNGRIAFSYTVLPKITAIEPGQASPPMFELGQNFPNPFNPSTAISFQLPAVSFVSIEVFDLLGRKVTTLVNEVCQPGQHTVRWDGAGSPSGVYYYRLHALGAVATKKAILIR